MLRLRDIMTSDVVTLAPDATLRDAVELFAARHVSGAPVVDGGRVVGVVSASDLLAFAAATPPSPQPDDDARVDDEWSDTEEWDTDDEPGARYFTELWADHAGDTAERFDRPASAIRDVLTEHTVAEVMTRHAVALSPNVDVVAAAEAMRAASVHRVLVMADGALVGIASALDVARAVAEQRLTRRTYVFDRSPF